MEVKRERFFRTYSDLILPDFPEESMMVGGYITFPLIASWIKKDNIYEIENALNSRKFDIPLTDEITNTTVLHVAAALGTENFWRIVSKYPALRRLVNSADIRGSTPLHCAAWYNNYIATKYLLDNGAEILFRTHISKRTVLHVAANLFTTKICEELLKRSNNKEFIDLQDGCSHTALMISVITDSPCRRILIDYGADYKLTNAQGRNICHLAVVHQNYEALEEIILKIEDITLHNAIDKNGDTPLMLAIRLGSSTSLDLILKSKFANELILRSQSVFNLLIDKCEVRAMESIMRTLNNTTLFNKPDTVGRPLLLYAVEKDRKDVVDLLIKNNINIKIRNYLTDETVLHVAAYKNNLDMISLLLSTRGIEDIINAVNSDGKTAYEVVLRRGSAEVWMNFVKTGLVKYEYFNAKKESSLFIAAKEGNYPIVLSLLLSPVFIGIYQNKNMFNKTHIKQMEMNGEIFPSDVYILTGEFYSVRGWPLSPPQDILFQENVNGQNIFHACALGESLECTAFMFNYCSKFNTYSKHLDKPDDFRNTPIYIVLKTGKPSLLKYFIQHGANLAHTNLLGQSVIDVMYQNMPIFNTVFLEVINEFAVKDDVTKELVLRYDTICPQGIGQMSVLLNIYTLFKGPLCINILTSPILQYFVMYKWNILKTMVGFRLILNSATVITYSLYLTYSLSPFLKSQLLLIKFLYWLTMVLSLIILIVESSKMFLLFKARNVFKLITYCYPILTLLYLTMDKSKRLTKEIGAVGILIAWFSIFIQGEFSRLSFQIAMFSGVLSNILKLMPVCILVSLAFSSSFFTLFHDFLAYNSPIHSFMSCVVEILQGDFNIPLFTNMEPIHKDNDMYEIKTQKGNINPYREFRNVFIEGGLLQFLSVFFLITLLNMLIGVSIRSSETMALEGRIHWARSYIQEIINWEYFIRTRFYKIVSKYKLSWFFGLESGLDHKLQVSTIMKPFSEHFLEDFDLRKLKTISTFPHASTDPTLKFYCELMKESERGKKITFL